MSDKDIWESYADRRRENKHRLTDMYMHVLTESNPFGSGWNPSANAVGYDPDQQPVDQQVQKPTDYGQSPDSDIMQRQSELVEDWIHSGGYKDREGTVGAILFRSIYNYVDWNKLHHYVNNGTKNSTTLQEVVTNGFKAEIVKQIKQIVRDDVSDDHLSNLYYTIFGITFAENTVSVGRGELILSLFTSCRKGSVGDLEYLQGTNSKSEGSGGKSEGGLEVEYAGETVQVEVKTGKGRAVSARGGMFKKANLAIEAAVMGVSPKSMQDVQHAGDVMTIQHDGQDIVVLPQKKGKKITAYLPIEGEEPLTTDEFISALSHADTFLEKLKPYATTFSDAKNVSYLKSLEQGAADNLDEIRAIRHRVSLACILYAYANSANGFQYLLIIKQSGSNAKVQTPAEVGAGTFEDVELIDCRELQSIDEAMITGNLALTRGGSVEGHALDGEGVYVSYAGSDTNIGWMAGRSTMHSDRKRGQLASELKPSTRKKKL